MSCGVAESVVKIHVIGTCIFEVYTCTSSTYYLLLKYTKPRSGCVCACVCMYTSGVGVWDRVYMYV